MTSRNRLTALAVVFALLLIPQTLVAQGLVRVAPEEVGMSSERLDRLSLALESTLTRDDSLAQSQSWSDGAR